MRQQVLQPEARKVGTLIDTLQQSLPDVSILLQLHKNKFNLRVDTWNSIDNVLIEEANGQDASFHSLDIYSPDKISADIERYVRLVGEIRNTGFIFYGLDAGSRVMSLFERTDRFFPLFILERHLEVFKAVFSYWDISELLRSKRVYFFLGENAALELSDFLEDKFNMQLPLCGELIHRQTDKEFYLQAAHVTTQKIKQILQEAPHNAEQVNSYYRMLTRDQLLSRFAAADKIQPGNITDSGLEFLTRAQQKLDVPLPPHNNRGPLTILGEVCSDTRFLQYIMRDSLQAFQQLGHTAVSLETDTGFVASHYLYKTLNKVRPHLWFKIDLTSQRIIPENGFVTVTWVQDYIPQIFNADRAWDKQINPYDQLLVMTKHFIRDLERIGFPSSKLHHFYYGANTDTYHPLELSQEDYEKYSCDISFVSHYPEIVNAYTLFSEPFVNEVFRRMVEEERYYADDFMDLIRESAGPGGGVEVNAAAIRDHARQYGINMESEYNRYICMMLYAWTVLATAGLRIPYLESIADKDLHIYGRSWDKDPALGRCAKGIVPNGVELCKVYNASKINLNLHPSTNNHIRVFEIIASGGFLLTYLTKEDQGRGGIGELFEIGTEIEVFRDKNELREKIEYYLSHEQEREEIARRGRLRVLQEHTLKHRMQQVLDIVGEGLREETA